MRIVAGVIGAVIGYFASGGNPIGAAYGWSIGYGVGSVLFPEAGPSIQGPRLSDLRVQDSTYGQPINILYGGAVRISGMVVWATPLVERSSSTHQGGKGGGGGSTVTTYSYYANCAVALCEGPVTRVQKIWADGKLIYDLAGGNISMGQYFRVYLGTETQMPDSFIESHEGVGSTPAYRGMCYVVFEGFPLADYANRIPQFSFEVVKSGTGTFTTTKIGTWANETTLGSFFSAPYLLGGTVSVASWGYYYGYTGVTWADIVPNAGTTERRIDYSHPWGYFVTNSPGDFPVIGHADEPGALIIGVDAYLAWMDGSGVVYQTTIPNSGAASLGTTYCKEGDFIWYSSNYGAGDYPIYRYDLQTSSNITYPGDWFDEIIRGGGTIADQLTISADRAPFSILGTTADYLYVANFDTKSVERRDKVTLEFVSNIATSNFLSTGTGYVLSDDLMYLAAGGGGVTKIKEGVVTHLNIPQWWGVGSFAALAEDVFIWTDATLGDTINVYFSVMSGVARVPLSQVVTEVCERVGLSASDIDVAPLASDLVDGYVVARRTSARGLLEPLAATYNFDATESDHIIKFVKRGSASIRTIPADDLAAYDSGDEPPAIVAGQRTNDLEMPIQVDLSYMRRESDYQNSTQTARRPTAPGDNVVSLEFPLVLADDFAKAAAETQLTQAWLARQKESWQTTRKHLDLEPCDVVTLPLADGWTPVRITKKDESRNGLIKWEGEVYDESTYTGFDTTTYGGLGGQTITGLPPGIYPSSTGLLLDLPALRDQDSDPGYYWAAAGSGSLAWAGAVLFESYYSDSNYTQLASLTTGATIGKVSNTLGSGPTGIFDEGNVITVVMGNSATLASVTRDSVMNGSNAALVGKEIIQFRTATLTAPNTYQLSGLLRGRKGTEWAVGTHQTGETFLLLQPVGIVRLTEQVSNLNQTKPFKTVTVGQSLTDVSPVNFTPKGNALKPYAPVQLGGGRDASGNVLLNWRRRTRIAGELRDGFDVALNEATEAYDIEIWNSGYTTLKRTFSNVNTASLTYLASDQTTDFGSPQSKVYVKIFQLSATVGRGDELKGAI